MRQLKTDARARILSCMVEGNSLRATSRMTGAAINTVMKLVVDLGTACDAYQDDTLRNLSCRRVQLDELWAFVGCRKRNVTDAGRAQGWGDIWTWLAVCADTKLVPTWYVGQRSGLAADAFVTDLRSRLGSGVQVTTDALKEYRFAIKGAFGQDVHYATQTKLFAEQPGSHTRYCPGRCQGVETKVVRGQPDPEHISTSYVERLNLSVRMGQRRFTRLTNAHSKKAENHAHAVAIHFMHYNFARVHQTLKTTPAIAAGVANHVWSLEEIVGLLARTDLASVAA